ncbi:cation:proton antiporter [Halopseudomonas salina]|uniref:Sodium/hydrogen antiporter n=1 Tax=Halopseudomonas salina TaxID=1323744 RepID=A0ABQ1PYZ8_9GAMM|nr:sodium:proton antiporter [Halopseudomonas salina]GGD06587.1 sodium/hydrogen antiporter [Halopseudomonas salina]
MLLSASLSIAVIGLISFGCQWLAWRVKLPAILFLLAAGIVLGPFTSVIDPDQLFGDLLFPLISLSVAIILFEGSLTLNMSEIRSQKAVVQRLITLGAGITWLIVAIATHFLIGVGWELSILFGALAVVTGPTVIVPMLRTVRPNRNISNILRWEGILIDPIGALLVVVVYEFIVAQSQSAGVAHGLLAFLEIIAVGTILGIAGGWFLGFVLKRGWVPHYLQNLATLSVVFAAFSISDSLAHESGLLAVTLMGMWLANKKDLHINEILNFKENLSVVLISGLFILLAARLTLDDILALGWTPLLLLLVMQLIARPASIWISSIGSSLTWQEKSLLSWIAPRGIVAAAVSALFAIRLEEAGQVDAGILVPLTFSIIIGTVVLQSATSRGLARLLKVAEPAAAGFLVVGANPVARSIARALHKQGVRVVLTDTQWEHIRDARMEGLETFYGNAVSAYADQHLDLVGVGRLLALSPSLGINVVASMRYGSEFGAKKVYTLLSTTETDTAEKHKLGTEHRGHTLFDKGMSYSKLASLLSKGWEIRTTKLSEEFDFTNLAQLHEGKVVPLFAISPKGRLEVFVDEGTLDPKPGWQVLSLTPPKNEEAKKVAQTTMTDDSREKKIP